MPTARSRKNPDGTTSWFVDPYKAEIAAMLGDDFDYSQVTEEDLTELEEKLRQRDQDAAGEEPTAGQDGSA